MFQNFKTDIIYYKTATDFEMEFNLCGCCRMRLLNDKCSDKKDLFLSLSRAVSRSQIIIITAPLFDGENITAAVASAIGSTTQKVDNSAYGINNDTEFEIISNSTPLVTADGIFGGCIIESGPQTLILLTDNKTVRKTIMKTLIHPYISELTFTPEKSQADENIQNDGEIPAETTEPISEDENSDLSVSQVEESDETQNSQEDMTESTQEKENISEPDAVTAEPDSESGEKSLYSDNLELYTESATPKNIFTKKTIRFDEDDYEAGYYTETSQDKKFSRLNILLLVVSIILLAAIAVLCFCIFFIPAESGTTPTAYMQEIFETMFG